ncbi:MAG: amidohydrolase [Microthrixaceae bacterium]|nr:amidohydrolase [Microthrixaceae bacterium]
MSTPTVPQPSTSGHAHGGEAVAGCCGSGLLGAGLGALARTGPPTPATTLRTPPGTFVIRGARVLTVDARFSSAEAIAVHDGRIAAVGTLDEVTAAAEAHSEDVQVVDRPGATILPGFVEPHAHVLPTALFAGWADVGAQRFDTVDAVLAHLADLAAAAEPGRWVLGRLFDPSLQAGPDELTADLLDTVSPEAPVAVLNASLHLAYVNSAALAVAGVDASTPDLDGSPYGRWPDGSPNGVLKGQAAMLSVLGHNPALMEVNLAEAALAVTARAAAKGVTTICDQGAGGILGPGDLDVYAEIAATGRMATRLRYSAMDLRADGFDQTGLAPGDGDDLVRAVGWKVISDGSNQGRTGHQREPYLDSDDTGIAYVEPDALVDIVAERAALGWQLVVHANGDRAIDDTLDAFEALPPGLRADRRHRIEHCSFLHDDQIARIAAMGLSPSFLIGHVHYWGRAFRDEIVGPEKARLLDRTASCTTAGIRWTLHSDEMVTPIDPLRCVENAVTRSLWREPGSVLAPEERVDVETAIRSMTADAAWQCHSDGELGSLEVGKLADLVVLADDPTTVDPSRLRHIEVLETYLGGRRVHPEPA